MKARFSIVVWSLSLAVCSNPGVNLIRHDVSDAWSGEPWVLDVPHWEDGSNEGFETDVGDAAGPEDRGPADTGPTADTGGDLGALAPVQFVTDDEALPALLGLIALAQERVDLMHLEFLDGALPDQVADALLAAAGRGVVVRVLLEGDVHANAARVASLSAGGAEARLDSSSRSLHVKLAVADGDQVLVGSTNLSTSSLKYNREANWLFSGIAGEAFAEYASRLWAADGDLWTLDASGDDDLRLLGDGQYTDTVVPLIEGATRRVLVIQYYVDSNDKDTKRLLWAIQGARARGADVRVLIEKSGFSTSVNAANEETRQVLDASGVEVRFDSPGVITHAKVVVADDWVVVYSGNWSASGLRRNHEAGAAIRSPEIASEAAAYFDTLWAMASP